MESTNSNFELPHSISSSDLCTLGAIKCAIFDLLKLIVSAQALHHDARQFTIVCISRSLADNNTMSSPYNSIEMSSSSVYGIPTCNRRISCIKSFTKALNKRGDRMHPCLSPVCTLN